MRDDGVAAAAAGPLFRAGGGAPGGGAARQVRRGAGGGSWPRGRGRLPFAGSSPPPSPRSSAVLAGARRAPPGGAWGGHRWAGGALRAAPRYASPGPGSAGRAVRRGRAGLVGGRAAKALCEGGSEHRPAPIAGPSFVPAAQPPLYGFPGPEPAVRAPGGRRFSPPWAVARRRGAALPAVGPGVGCGSRVQGVPRQYPSVLGRCRLTETLAWRVVYLRFPPVVRCAGGPNGGAAHRSWLCISDVCFPDVLRSGEIERISVPLLSH